MLTVLVTAAGIQDSIAGERLLDRLSADHPGLRKGWADRGYREYLVDHTARPGIGLEVVRRIPGTKGFKVLPRRWVVQRTLGWLVHHHHRLARDYEAAHPLHRHDPHRHDQHRDDRPHDPPHHPQSIPA